MLATIIVFFIILSILILVHEAGHFTAAKKLGIKVEEFGFGLPPKIFGFKKGETVYSINWLPMGGFVRLFGEDGEDIKKKKGIHPTRSQINKRAFYTRPAWQKSLVLLSGVGMNFFLAVIIISYLFTQGVMVPTDRVHIEKVLPGTPAQVEGLMEGDVLKKLRLPKSPEMEIEIKTGEQLIKTTKEYLGQEITLVVERGGNEFEYQVVPRRIYPSSEGPMGIVISNYEEKKYSLWQAPILGTKESLVLSYELTKGIAKTLWKLISFQPVSKDVAGPIGIAQMTGRAVKSGENAVLELLGLLSLNLAIVNILPFPALDGGRLLFVFLEKSTGKKLRTSWERYIHQIGMIILLALMLLVTVNDLIRIFSK